MSNSNHVCERVFREILQGKLPCATLRTRCPSLKSPGWGRELGQEPVVRWHRMFDLKKGLQRAVWGKAEVKVRALSSVCVFYFYFFIHNFPFGTKKSSQINRKDKPWTLQFCWWSLWDGHDSISKDLWEYLRTKHPQVPTFYRQPKIHIKINWPHLEGPL